MPVVVSWRRAWACRPVPTLPLRRSVTGGDAQAGPESLKGGGRQPLSHDVGELQCGWHVQHTELSKGHLLTNKVDVEFDVLGPAVVYWVLSKIDSRHIVTVDNGSFVDAGVKFL